MAKRGRPPGADSAQTRERIINAAREEFARSGFAATAITTVAANAGLAPSAIYHYFGGKAELYEAVFDATSSAIWGDLGQSATRHDTFRDAVMAMLTDAGALSTHRPHFSDFLALVPMEARLHTGFDHLMEQRSKYQDETFGALAELGIRTGEIRGFEAAEVTEVLRSIVMGWFFEGHFRGRTSAAGVSGIGELFDQLARGVEPPQ